jgi:hypothetical protein
LRDSERRARERLYRMGITHGHEWSHTNSSILNSDNNNSSSSSLGSNGRNDGKDHMNGTGDDITATGSMMKKRTMKSRTSKMGATNDNNSNDNTNNNSSDDTNTAATLCIICKHQLWVSAISCRCSSTKATCLSHSRELCNCTPSNKVHILYLFTLCGCLQSARPSLVSHWCACLPHIISYSILSIDIPYLN